MDSIVHGVTKSQTRLSDFHFQLRFGCGGDVGSSETWRCEPSERLPQCRWEGLPSSRVCRQLPLACVLSGPLESSSLAPRPSTLAPPCSPTSLRHQSLLSEQCRMPETPRDLGFGGYGCRPREPTSRWGVGWAASLFGATTRSDVRKTCVTRPLRQGHVLRAQIPVMLAVWQPQSASWPLPSQPTTKVRPCRTSRRAQF